MSRIEIIDNRLLVTSDGLLWQKPNSRYYNFLSKIGKANLPKKIAVLGCADGNYVIPAARKGFNVLAIDIDEIALYGGVKKLYGKELTIGGLQKRLQDEDLEHLVTIVLADFISYSHQEVYSGVLTSGTIHYQENESHSLSKIVKSIQEYVSIGGYILLEYLLLSEENRARERHFVTQHEMSCLFPANG